MSTGTVDPKVLESIPLAVLKTQPAGAPPPGVQPNFVDPSTRVPAILGVAGAFIALALFCFSLRIYTKLAIAKNWRWDDLTCLLGFMCVIVYSAAVVNGCVHGATGRHVWDVHLDKVLSKSGLYQGYITTITATPALGLIKSSLFIQYYLLFRPLRWVRISVWTGATISTLFYAPITIVAFVLNSPWPGETFFEGQLSWHYLEFSKFSIPTGVIGMLVDWYLFILPIPAVLNLQMSTAKKIGILVIFMTGGLAAIASTVGLYYRVILSRNLDDASWHVSYVLLWTQVEMFTGVAVSSMPTVKQFFSRQDFVFMSWGSSLKSSLSHLLSSSTREKISDDNHSFTAWSGSKTQTSIDGGKFRMKDLESNGGQHKVGKYPRREESQIHLTHDISVTQDRLDDAPKKR